MGVGVGSPARGIREIYIMIRFVVVVCGGALEWQMRLVVLVQRIPAAAAACTQNIVDLCLLSHMLRSFFLAGIDARSPYKENVGGTGRRGWQKTADVNAIALHTPQV